MWPWRVKMPTQNLLRLLLLLMLMMRIVLATVCCSFEALRSWILFSRDGDAWLRFGSKCLVEILKMKFDQDLCLNLWYDPIGYFGKMNSTLGSVVPLAMFSFHNHLENILYSSNFFLLVAAHLLGDNLPQLWQLSSMSLASSSSSSSLSSD